MVQEQQTPPQRHRDWLVLLADMGLSVIGSFIAIMLMRWLTQPIIGFDHVVAYWLLASCACSLIGLTIFRTQKIVIRHSSYRSIGRLIEAGIAKVLLLGVTLWVGIFPHFESYQVEVMLLLSDFLLTLFLLVTWRIVLIAVLDDMRRNVGQDVDKMHILVFGTSEKAVSLVTRLADSEHYLVAGFVSVNPAEKGRIIHDKKVYHASNEEELQKLKTDLGIEGIITVKVEASDAQKSEWIQMCLNLGIHLLTAPTVAELPVNGIRSATSLKGSDFIPDGMNGFERNTKRIIDCILAAILLVVFSPLILLCWILVKREDGGPAIYKQERIGRFGRPFNIYKFRSMRLDAEKMGPALFSGDEDPRLTKIGKFLRLHHLDELPQLWNVFVGDMAFIGPRPERQFYIDQIMERDPRYTYLYQIRPGVTSYATLRNGYTDTIEKMVRRLEFDLYYLRHRSLWFDIKILWQTFASIAFGKKF